MSVDIKRRDQEQDASLIALAVVKDAQSNIDAVQDPEQLSQNERLLYEMCLVHLKVAQAMGKVSERLSQRWARAKKYPEFSYVLDDNAMKTVVDEVPANLDSLNNVAQQVADQLGVSSERLEEIRQMAASKIEPLRSELDDLSA